VICSRAEVVSLTSSSAYLMRLSVRFNPSGSEPKMGFAPAVRAGRADASKSASPNEAAPHDLEALMVSVPFLAR